MEGFQEDKYRILLSWYIDVIQDIRLKRNLQQRLTEVENVMRDIDERIESDVAKGITSDVFPTFKNEVAYLKYQLLETL